MSNKFFKVLLIINVSLLAVAYTQKDKLPEREDILDQLYSPPSQTETHKPPFETTKGGITYTITPVYEYTLFGMVVSYHHSSSWLDLAHKSWKDFINIKDICVIWGENIKSEVYKDLKFSSSDFTCHIKWANGGSRKKYRNNCLSNNHLLSDDQYLNKIIMNTQKGDQIYFKGYLVHYSRTNNTFNRTTSISRDDTGNGACETIYLKEYGILKKANPGWRLLYSIAKYGTISCIIILTISFFITPSKIKKVK